MTNSTTDAKQEMTRAASHPASLTSDTAPMVITRLSGWIGSNEAKAPAAAWIVPTRVRTAQ
ncbi:MAG TPA: hypothetical protein VN696_06490 [Pyrinomonadaceae bacterium]|nr:hypothetical protein [Pyrinomonadaceae bacterium]